MLVKIPLYFIYEEPDTIDYDSLGIAPPKHESCDDELVVRDTYVDPNAVTWIEPKIDGDGCYFHVKGVESGWRSPLSVEEAANLINNARK